MALKFWAANQKLAEVGVNFPLPVQIVSGGGGGGSTDVSLLNKEATQLTLATKLDSILSKLSSDPATQATLAAVLAKLPASPATEGTLSALSSAQGASNTTLANVLTALNNLLAQAQDITATGNITVQNSVPAGVATANSALELSVAGRDTLNIQITGTYTGALSVQGTQDGTAWVTVGGLPLLNVATGGVSNTIPSASVGIYQFGCSGFSKVRVTALAAVTGTAVITLRAVDGNSLVALDSALPAGSNAIGTVALSALPALVAGSAAIGTVSPSPANNSLITAAASTNATSVATSAKTLYNFVATNVAGTADIWVRFYNKATSPVVGTDIPVMTFKVPLGTTLPVEFGNGFRFTTGISIAITGSAANDTTVVAAGGVGATVSSNYL